MDATDKTFIVFNSRVSIATHNTKLFVDVGCDKKHHAMEILEMYYDHNNKIVGGTIIFEKVIGECDGSCKHYRTEGKGAFILEDLS